MLPFPQREVQAAMAALTRAGYSYYLLAHGDDPAVMPVHTGLLPATLALVVKYVHHRLRGTSVSLGYHILEEELVDDEIEVLRYHHTLTDLTILYHTLTYPTIP